MQLLCLMTSALLLGGCQAHTDKARHEENKPSEMKASQLPKTRALQDPFTREFLTSVKEVKKGYYPFQSKTKKYTMNFPVNAVISELDYEQTNTQSEFISAGISYADKSSASLDLTYDGGVMNADIKDELDYLKGKLQENVSFTKVELNGRTLYWTPTYLNDSYYAYAGYVHPADGNGGVEMIYFSRCGKGNETCHNPNVEKKVQTNFYQLIETIKFKNPKD